MATIPIQGTGVRHVRKTIALDGGANNGNLGDQITVFSTTGWVCIVHRFARVTETLVAADLSLVELQSNFFKNFTTANMGNSGSLATTGTSGFAFDPVYMDFTSTDGVGVRDPAGNDGPIYTNGDFRLKVNDLGGGADITNGTIIVDMWYFPITDDGAMSGSDIDVSLESAIKAEVVDALNVDTYAEPGQEAPGATVSLAKKISYLYKAWRNKNEATNSAYKLYADDGSTVDQKATLSDDGTTFTRTEIATGP